jgi:hypothetical protein
MNNLSLSPDRFGHWVVSGKKYSIKLQAVKDAVALGHWIHWDFNESVFKNYNWQREPKETLIELYDKRARQLREKYAFIALEYSGGADSYNILEAFCRQKLKIDIVIHKTIGSKVKPKTDKSSTNHWAEGKYQGWILFNKLKEIYPDIKWFTWDIEEGIYQSWIHNPIDIMSANSFHPGAVSKLPDRTNTNPANIPELPSTAYICGTDKPLIEFDEKGWYVVFSDSPVFHRSVAERSLLGIGWDDILFYWDPDCADLICKQAHIIKQFFQKNSNLKSTFFKDGKPTAEYKAFIRSLIYPGYKEIWQGPKARGTHAITTDDWFMVQKDHPAFKAWFNVMTDLSKTVEELTINTEYKKYTVIDKGSIPFLVLADCPSIKYFLGSQ